MKTSILRTAVVILIVLASGPAQSHAQSEPSAGEGDYGPVVAASQPWALLVGVGNYIELGALRYACRDVEVLKEQLVKIGFPTDHVVLMHDKAENRLQPFRANILAQLDRLVRNARSPDLVIFAASMHGVHLGGTSYLCPIETRAEDVQPAGAQGAAAADRLLSLADVSHRLQTCPAQRKLLIVDACRNRVLSPGRKSAAESHATVNFAKSLGTAPQGLWILSSCREGEVSLEDESLGHGLFMHFLLQGLDGGADFSEGNNDGKLQLFELFNFAHHRTSAFARTQRSCEQIPTMSGEGANFELGRAPKPGSRQFAAKSAAPVTVSPMIELGNLFIQKKDYDAALAVFDKLIEINPDDKTAYAYRGVIYRETGDYPKAAADFQKAGKSLNLMITLPKVQLQVESQTSGVVQGGEQIQVTEVHEDAEGARWLWVNSVNQDESRRGWVQQQAVSWDPELVAAYLQPTSVRPYSYEETRTRAGAAIERYNEIRSLPGGGYLPSVPSIPYIGNGVF